MATIAQMNNSMLLPTEHTLQQRFPQQQQPFTTSSSNSVYFTAPAPATTYYPSVQVVPLPQLMTPAPEAPIFAQQQSMPSLNSPSRVLSLLSTAPPAVLSSLQMPRLMPTAPAPPTMVASTLPRTTMVLPSCLEILDRLGSQTRTPDSPLIDVLALPNFAQTYQDLQVLECDTFPFKLHQMLTAAAAQGIVTWCAQGRAFSITNRLRFVEKILPQFSSQTAWGSFQRQLHNYGFTRMNSGLYRGAFMHDLFVKDHDKLVTFMKRVRAAKRSVKKEA